MDGADIAIDVQYQTAWQKYCDLMGELGRLTAETQNWDLYMESRVWVMAALVIVIGILLGIGVVLFAGWIYSETSYRGRREDTRKGRIQAGLIIGTYVALFTVAAYLFITHEITMAGFYHDLSIASVESQLDALETTWGFTREMVTI